MDNLEYFGKILKDEFGFKKVDINEYNEEASDIFRKEFYGRDFIVYISVYFNDDGETLGITIQPRNDKNNGLDVYQGKFSLDKTKKLIERYRKICKT